MQISHTQNHRARKGFKSYHSHSPLTQDMSIYSLLPLIIQAERTRWVSEELIVKRMVVMEILLSFWKEQCVQVVLAECSSQYKKEISHSENNHSLLERPPQGCGGAHFLGGFWDVTRPGARKSHLGSLSHTRLGQMTFQGSFHPGLFHVLWIFISMNRKLKQLVISTLQNTVTWNPPIIILELSTCISSTYFFFSCFRCFT